MSARDRLEPLHAVAEVFVAGGDDGWIQTDGDGMAFVKPLWTSPESGGWAVLFRWKAGYTASAHKHLGAIHAYVVSGTLQLRDRVLSAGDYLYEPNGIVHDDTVALEDTVHLNIADGPVLSFDDDGIRGYFGWEQVESLRQRSQS